MTTMLYQSLAFFLLMVAQVQQADLQKAPSYKLEDQNRIEFWQQHLASPFPLVRKAAARNLASLKAYQSVELLESTISDVNPEVRDAAVRALGILGNQKTISLLRGQIKRDRDFVVKKQARKAIKRIKERLEQERLRKEAEAASVPLPE